MRHVTFVPTALVGLLLLAGCGGGGDGDDGGNGGSTPTVALWTGQYHHVAIHGPASDLRVGDVTTAWGVGAFDGAGFFTESASTNLDGTVQEEPRPGPEGATYALDPDRAVRFSAPSGEYARGQITEDGSLALLCANRDGHGPSIRVYGRREGTHDEAPLSGTWRMAAFSHAYTSSFRLGISGSMTFDASGGGSMTSALNRDGVIVPSAATPLRYVVLADGRVIVQISEVQLEGGLVRGGDVILLAGARDETEDPTFMVLNREAAHPVISQLAGSWFLASFGYDINADEYFGMFGRATTDAAGNLTATLTRNEEGLLSTLPPVGGSWEVSGTGLVTLTFSGGAKFEGSAVPDLDFVALSGSTVPASPAVFFLLR